MKIYRAFSMKAKTNERPQLDAPSLVRRYITRSVCNMAMVPTFEALSEHIQTVKIFTGRNYAQKQNSNLHNHSFTISDRDSSVGIALGYGLDDWGF
jgi:hypothetical protein